MIHKLFISILLLCSWPLSVAGQGVSLGTSQQDLTVLMNPDTPRPYQEVQVSLSSSVVDLNQSAIHWVLNGKTLSQGPAQKNFSFRVGKLGEPTTLVLLVETPNLGTIQKNLTIVPTQVDIVWQADTYTPPFYKGRALPVPEAGVTAVALPTFVTRSGTTIDSKNLVYTWTVNDRRVGAQSGLGRNTFKTSMATYVDNTPPVSLEVSDPESGLRANVTSSPPGVQPSIVMYQKDPLLGLLFNRALGETFSPRIQEFSIVAYPYFFSAANVASSFLNYQWSINNTPTNSTGNTLNQLTLRIPENSSGISLVGLSMTRNGSLFQRASDAVSIELGGTND